MEFFNHIHWKVLLVSERSVTLYNDYLRYQYMIQEKTKKKAEKDFIRHYRKEYPRTGQDWNPDLLSSDLDKFNQKLIDWLIWYNTKRAHSALC